MNQFALVVGWWRRLALLPREALLFIKRRGMASEAATTHNCFRQHMLS